MNVCRGWGVCRLTNRLPVMEIKVVWFDRTGRKAGLLKTVGLVTDARFNKKYQEVQQRLSRTIQSSDVHFYMLQAISTIYWCCVVDTNIFRKWSAGFLSRALHRWDLSNIHYNVCTEESVSSTCWQLLQMNKNICCVVKSDLQDFCIITLSCLLFLSTIILTRWTGTDIYICLFYV